MKTLQIKKTNLLAVLAMGMAIGASVVSADVFYNDFNGTPLTYTFGTTALSAVAELSDLDLPGTAAVTLAQINSYNPSNENLFQIYGKGSTSVVFKQNLEGRLYYAVASEEGQSWSDMSSDSSDGWGNISALATGSSGAASLLRVDPTYIPFRFADTTDSNIQKYGYIKMSTELSGSGASSVMIWTVDGYGYQTDGTEIAMGAIPEPATMGLFGLFGGGMLFIHRRFNN
ncbi:PEP-CTERM sorting domain-containing protein [Pontiella sulfatireligans]|uniref:PEP-CTERM protein-sorting domain-containing protein n=1 Tax=Pontiella sulfatireligans TaxID=2750658 RepID=A0A6C2UJU9_9BACT|nr:PEP-CTERM sorting domain-containing protein [Pontiella sulfatireligans]VGO19707.1 hypothetical protein SCARR_01766 [Pontiella sulfatireligans]